jgi:8-oxo-dGTP pyrophosphatase MutT (NUDIX family)
VAVEHTSAPASGPEPAILKAVEEPLTRGFLRLPGEKSANPPASPGGHVENFENAAEAAVREIGEETGWTARLVVGPSSELPAGAPHPLVPAPWWVQELDVHPDNHTPEPHVHVDHLFLAVAEGDAPAGEAVHEVRWFTAAAVAEHVDIAEDLRLQAKDLFGRIAEVAAG